MSGKGFLAGLLLGSILLGAFAVILFHQNEFGYLGSDTAQYLEFSDEIMSGRLFWLLPVEDIAAGAVLRSPGFPLVLSLARAISPQDLCLGLFVCHLLSLLTVFVSVSLLLERYLSPLALAACMLLVLIKTSDFFLAVTSEWTACSLLLLLFALLAAFYDHMRNRMLFAIALVCSCLVLDRPVFVFIGIVPLIASMRMKSKMGVMLACLGLLPVLVWMSFNWLRIGAFSLAPISGQAAFSVGAMIGEAAAEPDDEPRFREFISRFNSVRLEFSDREIWNSNALTGNAQYFRYLSNVENGVRIAKELGLDIVTTDSYLKKYALRSIKGNFARYLIHLRAGLGSFKETAPMLLPCLLLPLFWLRKGKNKGLCMAVLLMLAIHCLHTLVIIAVQPIGSRYFATTFYPLAFSGFVITLVFMREVFIQRRVQDAV